MPTSPFNLTVYSNDGQTVLYNGQYMTSGSDKITITQSGFYSSRNGTVNISYGANIQGWSTTVNASTPTYNIDTQYEGMEIFNSGKDNVFYVVLQKNKFVSTQGLNVLVNKIKSKQDKITNTNKLDYSLIKNTLVAGTNITIDANNVISATVPQITVDSALSTTSKNPVQNKIITEELNKKATMALPTNGSFRLDVGYSTVIIQTGIVSSSSNNGWHTVTLHEAMPDDRYILAGITGKNEGNNITMNIKNKTTTTFQVYLWAHATLDYIAIWIRKL